MTTRAIERHTHHARELRMAAISAERRKKTQTSGIAVGRLAPYIRAVGKPTMVINGVWNNRYGPGGSTRRLHHYRVVERFRVHGLSGGDPASTCVVKIRLLPGMIPPLSGQILSANDNSVALAA